jgi:5-methyltetrahydrofolate--homocysteine methyltransferase
MVADSLAVLLASGRPVAADGAMGTSLMAAGLPAGRPPDAWNTDEIGSIRVREVHRAHRAAGASILLTNTFGGNPIRLHMAAGEAAADATAICAAGVALARAEAAGALVAGSIGPTGALLEPFGDLRVEDAVAGFAVQARALAEAGVDLAWIETMSDLAEALAALEAVRAVAPDLPVVVTLAFEGDRTMMGVAPEEAATELAARGVAAVGANCGGGYAPVERAIARMHAAVPTLPLIAKANAGMPAAGPDGRPVFPGTPHDAAEHARRVVAAGGSVVGGCCGSSPAHVAAIAAALAEA